ncbi:VTT domain-containing protein [Candidatus Woesearchaeota archaeon]|nr:VTT domain-containing protein [Candidatus Woesearchaeota archaeon]
MSSAELPDGTKMKERVRSAISKYAFFIFLGIVFVLFIIFYSLLKNFAALLVSTYGFLGLFLLVVLMDTVIQPISPDLLVFGSTFGGANLVGASLVGGIASCCAGTLGYLIGLLLGKDGFRRWFGERHLKKGHQLFEKYGVWAVLVGAWSPIPYSSICWSAGIYRMPFLQFMIVSVLTRIPRFFVMGLIGYAL